MTGGRRAFRARVLTPESATDELLYLSDALVTIEDGRFGAVRAFAERDASLEPTDLRPLVLVPGFVDTHVHFPQTRITGSASGPLLDWLETTVFPEEAKFRERVYAERVAAEFTERLIRKGTTTSAVFSSSSPEATGVLFAELERSGLRALAGLTLMDQNCPDALRVPVDRALAVCEELAATWHGRDGGRLHFAVTPRFALSCSRPLLEGAAAFAERRGLFVQTHVAENVAEGEATLAAHPYASDYLGVYDAVGLLGPRTLLAHAIHFSDAEWDRVVERGARIAHCPDSNFFLGSGRMRLAAARARRVRVGLGSDVGAGRSFDMRRAVGYAYDNALCVGAPVAPEALLRMATLGGAEALGLERVIGSVAAGKDADFVAMRLPEYAEERARVVSEIAFGDAATVERVFVRGRELG